MGAALFLLDTQEPDWPACETLRNASSYKNNYGGIGRFKGRDEPNDNAEPVEEQEEGCASEH